MFLYRRRRRRCGIPYRTAGLVFDSLSPLAVDHIDFDIIPKHDIGIIIQVRKEKL